ncbi:MAG: ribonucleoside-diphosphate reductase subunit alpha [bacterium]|nr:ribonucleoside-diphosphate reductase subunit alpha [bacterium]
MSITKIKKRTGEIVPFNTEKIRQAMERAFTEVQGGFTYPVMDQLTFKVMETAEAKFGNAVPAVEDMQNVVERALMEAGWFDVAKAYIVYRHEHSKNREQETETSKIMVTKRSGATQPFSLKKIQNTLKSAAGKLADQVDIDLLAKQCESEAFDGMSTDKISESLIYSVRALVEKDPAYSKLASLLLLRRLNKQVIGPDNIDHKNIEAGYRAAFAQNIHTAIKVKRLDKRLGDFDLERLAAALKPERDELFWYMGAQTLVDRYLITNTDTKLPLETIQAFWMRVGMGLALNEIDKEGWAIKFYDLISQLFFVPSTPTLFHSGTDHSQMSSCYLTTVEDDLTHIFKCIGDNAQLSKWSGGLGNDWTNLRGTGSFIKGTGVESQGIIPFLKIANDTTAAINRSGRRRGATCAYLEMWHYDIESFIELRKNTGDERRRTHDMDIANWIPDLFIQRVKADADWTLFSPDETPDLHHIYGAKFKVAYEGYEAAAAEGKIHSFKKVKAKDLWKKSLSMLFETGHPWVTFKDPCNVRSPQDHVGVIHSSNLCTEITLNTSAEETAVCNLGSVNLARHITLGKLDTRQLKETVTIGMRMLDNTIDVNFYPTVEARTSNMRHRPVGMGIMGFQDALFLMSIDFASERMVKFADQSMEVISYYAYLGSADLAREKGAYQTFRGSKWDRGILPLDTIALLEKERGEMIPVDRNMSLDWTPVREAIRAHGLRNSNCLAIAPTATISNIAGAFPSIEPIYKNIYVKANQSGDFTVINNYLIEDLKKINLWSEQMIKKLKFFDGDVEKIDEIPLEIKNRYKESFQVSPQWLIKAAAARGKWIDQSQSLNLFYKGASGREISDIYLYAWEMGIKTTYYLRTLAASQVEKSTVNTAEFGVTHHRTTDPAGATLSVPMATPQPSPAPAPFTIPDAPVKLCLINDPTCEACQ